MNKKNKLAIDPLRIVLNMESKEIYKKERARFISKYEYKEHSFWGIKTGRDPIRGEAEWNSNYPNGYSDWVSIRAERLSSRGQQELIDKLNEVIDHINNTK